MRGGRRGGTRTELGQLHACLFACLKHASSWKQLIRPQPPPVADTGGGAWWGTYSLQWNHEDGLIEPVMESVTHPSLSLSLLSNEVMMDCCSTERNLIPPLPHPQQRHFTPAMASIGRNIGWWWWCPWRLPGTETMVVGGAWRQLAAVELVMRI